MTVGMFTQRYKQPKIVSNRPSLTKYAP